jgi:hypothetical protein
MSVGTLERAVPSSSADVHFRGLHATRPQRGERCSRSCQRGMTVGTAPGRQRAVVNLSHGASVREESIAGRPQHGVVRTQVVCHLYPCRRYTVPPARTLLQVSDRHVQPPSDCEVPTRANGNCWVDFARSRKVGGST